VLHPYSNYHCLEISSQPKLASFVSDSPHFSGYFYDLVFLWFYCNFSKIHLGWWNSLDFIEELMSFNSSENVFP
jgi:hypothetical protein